MPLDTINQSIDISMPKLSRRNMVRIVLASSLLIGVFGISAAIVARPIKSPTEKIVQSPLTGSGKHLPFGPMDSKTSPVGVSYVHGANSFTGTWSSDVQTAWRGTFTGLGHITAGNTGDPMAEFDFSGLAGGMLPAGTYLHIVDWTRLNI